jgi:hypothetical protein
MKIRIQSSALAFVLPHVCREESRPILGGVCVEPSGAIVATDGKTLCAHQSGASGAEAPVILRFHKPRELVARKVEAVEMDTDGTPARNLVATLLDKYGAPCGVTGCDVVEGPYPAWRQVVPHGDPVPTAALALNPEMVARFDRGDGTAATFTLYGPDKALLVTYGPRRDVVGLCMPCRMMDATPPAAPDWVAR